MSKLGWTAIGFALGALAGIAKCRADREREAVFEEMEEIVFSRRIVFSQGSLEEVV